MADLSKITLPNGTTYNLKDAVARADISAIQTTISGITGAVGGVNFLGETTTPISDLSTTNPVSINGEDKTAVNGSLVVYQKKEFLFDGTQWIELGDLTALGALATKDNASGSYTPEGTVSQPTFSGNSMTATGTFTPSGSITVSTNQTENKTATVSPASSGNATYTPSGSVTAPTISVSSAGSTTTVNSITSVGTLPAFGATVSNETLTLSWDAGTLPSKGANTTVKTGDATYSATAPSFTGTGVRLVTGNIAVPSSYTATFSGNQGNLSVSGTPSGTVSKPTFTGTTDTITVS